MACPSFLKSCTRVNGLGSKFRTRLLRKPSGHSTCIFWPPVLRVPSLCKPYIRWIPSNLVILCFTVMSGRIDYTNFSLNACVLQSLISSLQHIYLLVPMCAPRRIESNQHSFLRSQLFSPILFCQLNQIWNVLSPINNGCFVRVIDSFCHLPHHAYLANNHAD